MPGLAWGIFGAFIAVLLLMVISTYMISPMLFFVANETSNRSMAAMPEGNYSLYNVENTRASVDSGWLAVGYGFPIVSVAVIIAYVLDQNQKQKEKEQRVEGGKNEVPKFAG